MFKTFFTESAESFWVHLVLAHIRTDSSTCSQTSSAMAGKIPVRVQTQKGTYMPKADQAGMQNVASKRNPVTCKNLPMHLMKPEIYHENSPNTFPFGAGKGPTKFQFDFLCPVPNQSPSYLSPGCHLRLTDLRYSSWRPKPWHKEDWSPEHPRSSWGSQAVLDRTLSGRLASAGNLSVF